MPGIGLGVKIPLIKGVGFSAEYQAVYDSFTTKPSAAIANQQDIMVRALVVAGVWTKLDVFYLLAQTVNSAGEALKNWFNPGTFDATLVNAPAFVALEGFTGDGATSYIRSNWNPNTDSINYVLDSASGGIYIRTNVKEDAVDFGSKDAADFAAYMVSRWDDGVDGNTYSRINQADFDVNANTDSRGIFIVSREANNINRTYRNKNQIGDDIDASTAIPSTEMYLLCYNNNGVAASFSTKQASMVFFGSGFTQQNVDDMNDAVEVYMDSNGKGVIP